MALKKLSLAFLRTSLLNELENRGGARSTRGKKDREKSQSVYVFLQTGSRVGSEKQHFKSDTVLWEP